MREARVLSTVTSEESEWPPNGGTPVDHERLKYVTKLLGSHQGLYTALLGTVIFFLDTGKILQHWVSRWSTLLAALATVALAIGSAKILIAADSWIPEYYQRRFGSVQAARAPGSKWNALFSLALLLAFLVLLFLGQPIAHYFDPVDSHLHMMVSDPDRQINLWPSVFWVVLLCGSLRCQMSGIERQRLYFMLVGMIGFASIVSYAIFHPEAKELDLWKLLNTGGFGLSLIALGLYDHTTLVLLLPKRVAEGDDE
jgi:MFS family permease